MEFPAELKYTKEHEWLKFDAATSVATIGITEFAQGELGDIVFVDIEAVGSEIAADGIFGTIEAVKTVSELYAPVAGTIEEINPILDGNPERVNEDPYGDGWMIKMKVADPADLDSLLSNEEYAASVA